MSMNPTDAANVSAHLKRMAEPGLGNELRGSLLRVASHLDAQIARMNQPLFNPSAFPVDYVPGVMNGEPGMSLRDYFAAHANIGNVDELTPQIGTAVLGRVCPDWAVDARGCWVWWAEFRAALRFIEADAMLQERDK